MQTLHLTRNKYLCVRLYKNQQKPIYIYIYIAITIFTIIIIIIIIINIASIILIIIIVSCHYYCSLLVAVFFLYSLGNSF